MYVENARKVERNGFATIYRSVLLPLDRPWSETLQIGRVGASWSFKKNLAIPIYESAYRTNVIPVTLRGRARCEAFDWNTGLLTFLKFVDEEWEGRLEANADIEISAVKQTRIIPPIRANVGPLTDRWRRG